MTNETSYEGMRRRPRSLSYSEWMPIAAEEYARMLDVLRQVRSEQWTNPTDCSSWDVRQIVAHLSGAAASNASVLELFRQAYKGWRTTKTGDLVDRMNEVQVRERSTMSPQQLITELEENARRGLKARGRLPSVITKLPMPFGPPLGTQPIGYLMGRIYTRDVWMHRIDITRATGIEMVVTPAHDGAIVEDVIAEWEKLYGSDYDLELYGEAGGRWSSGIAEPTSLDAIEFVRHVSGRETGLGPLGVTVPF